VLTATTHSDFFHEAQRVFINGAKTVKSSKTFHLGIENDSGATQNLSSLQNYRAKAQVDPSKLLVFPFEQGTCLSSKAPQKYPPGARSVWTSGKTPLPAACKGITAC
jgi:hypothetical protein